LKGTSCINCLPLSVCPCLKVIGIAFRCSQ
jgi:hypothetical protein